MKELDFENEAKNQEQIGDNMRRQGVDVIVPRLSTNAAGLRMVTSTVDHSDN